MKFQWNLTFRGLLSQPAAYVSTISLTIIIGVLFLYALLGETHDNLKLEKTIKELDADQYQACNNVLCQFTVMPHWRVSVMMATLVGLLSSLLYSVVLHPTRHPHRLIHGFIHFIVIFVITYLVVEKMSDFLQYHPLGVRCHGFGDQDEAAKEELINRIKRYLHPFPCTLQPKRC